MKKFIKKYITIYSFIILHITGCGYQNEVKYLNEMFSTNIFHKIETYDCEISRKSELIINNTSSFMDNYISPEDVTIDFPFSNNLKNYSLYLHSVKGSENEYKLVLCDSDKIIQILPCGKISGSPEIFINDGIFKHDLEIFFYDELSDRWTGILFDWNWNESDRFKENPIRIPKYDEIADTNRIGIISVIDDNDSIMENTLFEVSDVKESAVEIRKWTFDKNTGSLIIYDSLENKNIFEGNVTLDENGKIVNEEYYNHLFLYEIPPIRNYESEEEIEITSLDDIPNMEIYPNKQDFLLHYGFENEEPFYQYYDILGNLLLELYFNEETEIGCGIRYNLFYNSDLERDFYISGFSFNSVESETWTDPETFVIKPYGHKTNNIKDIDGIENYEETMEYNKKGKPDYFKSQGIITYVNEDSISTLLSIDFIYRDNGTLFYKDYSHSPFAFETTNCSMNLYYDESERILFEDNYITHGNLEYYYIYKDNSKKPAYCLNLDNCHSYIPYFIKYN